MVNWNNNDLNAYEVRRALKSAGQVRDSREATSEHKLHRLIAAECTRRGWLVFHGSMAHATHKTLGEPDFVILANGGRTFFIEAKSGTGKLSKEQQAIHVWAARLDHMIFVVRSLEQFMEVIK